MVRLLLHSEDAAYDASTKKFSFALDRRLDKPTSLKVVKVQYGAATATSYPLVIYMRSDALHRVIKDKHSLRLKNANHEETTNIICTLTETDNSQKYSLEKDGRTFITDPHVHLTNIDIYFTNNATILDGELDAAAASTSTVTDTDIANIPTLNLWQDMRENTLLSSTYTNTPSIGDNFRYIYQNAAANQTMVFNTYGDMQVAALGQGRGMMSNVSWNYAIDGSMPNVWSAGGNITYVFSFKMAHTATGDIKILNHRAFEIEFRSGVVFLKDGAGAWISTNLLLIPTKDYMLTVRRMDEDGDGVFSFECSLENLETNAVSTGSVPGPLIAENNQTNWWYSNASQHYFLQSGVMGPLIAWNNIDPTHVTNAQNWIRGQYEGTDTTVATEDPSPGVDATWFVELEVN